MIEMGLIAWYKFEDNVNDSSGNSYNGTIVGSPTYINGKIGKSIDMDGQNDYINVGTHNIILEAGKSFSVWLNMSQIGSAGHSYYPGIFAYNAFGWDDFITLSNSDGASAITSGTANTRIRLEDDDGSAYRSNVFEYTIGTWVHICLVFTNDGYLKYYVNGSLLNTDSYPIGSYNSLNIIGRGYGGATYDGSFYGNMDDFRVYDHALSAYEVNQLSMAKVGHWTFDTTKEKTLNIVTNTNLDTGWKKFHNDNILWNDIDPPINNAPAVVSFTDKNTDGNGYWFSYGDYAPQTDDTVYTVSLYVKTDDTGDVSIRAYTADNSETDRHWTNILTVTADDGWKRLVWDSFRTADPTDSDSLSFRWTGLYDNGFSRLWLCAPQMEPRATVSDFVVGSRNVTYKDCSGYGNSFTPYDYPSFTDGRIGIGAIKLDGDDDYLTVSANSSLTLNGDWTVSHWAKLDGTGTAGKAYWTTLCSGAYTGNGYDDKFHFWFDDISPYEIQCRVGGGSAGNEHILQGTADGSDNDWHHIVCTYDDSTTTFVLYVDDEVQETYNAAYSSCDNDGSLSIGRWWGYANYFNGCVDDIQIFSTCLSPTQISQLYKQRASLDGDGNLWL